MPGPRGPLSVRVHDGTQARDVTRHATGIRFSKVSNGGHRAASMRLNLPGDYFTDLGPSDRVWIDNTTTGANLFSGYTQNPTPLDGPAGQGFELSALGGMILAADQTQPLLYVERDLTAWEKDPFAVADSSAETGQWADNQALNRIRTQLSSGVPVDTGGFAGVADYALARAGLTFGGLSVYVQSGKTDPGYRATLAHPTGSTDVGDLTQVTTIGVRVDAYAGLSFPTGTDVLSLRLRRVGGATNIADDLTWTDWVDLSVIGQRLTRYGELLAGTSHAPLNTVRASQVVEDLLGRLLVLCDPTRAVVTETWMPINQLSFPEPASAQRVLDELGEWEADMRWGMGSDDGLPHSEGSRGHDFWYTPLSPEPRYEVTSADTLRLTGAETDLCNRVTVHWVDSTGADQTTIVEVDSDQYPALRALESAGRVRDADPVPLPPGKGSTNNALVIGHEVLAAKAQPPRSGTVVISRYVRDLWTGATVHPCEVEPGCLVRLRSTGDVIECTEMEYDDDAGAVTLTLGDPVPTDEQRTARLAVT